MGNWKNHDRKICEWMIAHSSILTHVHSLRRYLFSEGVTLHQAYLLVKNKLHKFNIKTVISVKSRNLVQNSQSTNK